MYFATLTSMHRTAWFIIIGLLVPGTLVHAGEWENAMTDFELYDEVISNDSQDLDRMQQDAQLEDSQDLFPVPEGQESSQPDEVENETHVTIKVDGVPVILEDVPVFEWFASYVRDAAERGFVSGYKDADGRPTGFFGPADSVTVEQVAKMAVLAADIDPFACLGTLKNTSALGSWSERYVLCAESKGWAIYGEATVDVARPATRSEVVVTLLQAYGVRIAPISGTLFEDVTRSTPYGAAIETAAQLGIVSGYSDAEGVLTGLFGPDDLVNRAQAAKMFSLAAQVN